MNQVLLQGLMITVIGMGLVFVVIIFLWWLMGLLVRLTTPKSHPPADETQAEKAEKELRITAMTAIENKRRAAVAAVAVALALEQSNGRPLSFEPDFLTGTISPWQSVHRSRQFGAQQTRG